MKEDVKEKLLPFPLEGDVGVVTYIQPVSFSEGLLVWPLWLAADSSGDTNPSCMSRLVGFMKQWCSTPFGSEATQAKCWLKCQPRSYVRLEAYSFFGLSEGA
jgi:hypothetical protein